MKKTLGYIVLLATSFSAYSQAVENDDVYFSSRDRAKLKVISTHKRIDWDTKTSNESTDEALTPTGSYASRNVNPDYSNSGQGNGSSDDGGYYDDNYAPTGVNGNL